VHVGIVLAIVLINVVIPSLREQIRFPTRNAIRYLGF
jgi:hypothetical protein